MNFFSRAGLDQFLFEYFFRGKRDGVFVEVGSAAFAEAGNTLFFERFLGWKGLCIEPDAQTVARVREQRKCPCEEGSPRDLARLLLKHSLSKIDYLALNAPGLEAETLSGLDPERFEIRMLSVRSGDAGEQLGGLLSARGFDFIARLGDDLVFKRRDVVRLPRTTVICAVWHRDANRHRLLEGHAANLARQTVPVEPIYIFDGGDPPPETLPGRKVVAHEGLTIYQAWNLGLALAGTPFVMNLNLDDRLAPNAVELLEMVLLRESAVLVGGEWKICYSQEETDAVEPAFPAERLPFFNAWPPPKGTPTRLGSGTGERGTLGPATLWRLDTHIGAPRYPWRLPDGSLIKVIADSCWWTIITQHLKKKVVRIADVIGNYHSHPGEQAEFRGPPDEAAVMSSVGLSLF